MCYPKTEQDFPGRTKEKKQVEKQAGEKKADTIGEVISYGFLIQCVCGSTV